MPVQLETERLALRLPQLDDAEAMLDFFGNAEVMRPIGSEPGGIDLAVEHLVRWVGRWRADDQGQFIVVRKDDGRVLGRVGSLVWNARTWETSTFAGAGADAQVELGWAIGREHWGSGYATEAARTVREWLYDDRGVEHLISLIAPENTRSQRVAAKLDATPGETVQAHDGPATIWVHPR